MKAISFLGTTDYNAVTYVHKHKKEDGKEHEETCTTHLFPHAVAHFFAPTALLVCLTPKAKSFVPQRQDPANTKTHFQTLCDIHEREGLVTPTPVDIPNGENPEELWEIFQRVADVLTEGDEVIFDITHGFRSLPLLALLATAYLRIAKQINIRTIVYGAFEARRPDGQVPVFDLSPFLDLFKWTTATDQFLKTGNAQELARLLSDSTGQCKPLAENIRGIAQSLHVLRPLEVMEKAPQLPAHIVAAEQTITGSVSPFATLLTRIQDDYGKFGLRNPESKNNDRKRLVLQLKIAQWYAEKEQIVHALSMAREWMPSLLCYCFKLDPLNRTAREKMEELLKGNLDESFRGKVYRWADVPYGDRLRPFWQHTADLRNDVLHAGLRREREKAEDVLKKTTEIMTELHQVAQLWHLLED